MKDFLLLIRKLFSLCKIALPINLINSSFFYCSSRCGGIEVTAQNGKIKCINTLESRLEAISQHTLPMIRVALFGRNPNRKFDD